MQSNLVEEGDSLEQLDVATPTLHGSRDTKSAFVAARPNDDADGFGIQSRLAASTSAPVTLAVDEPQNEDGKYNHWTTLVDEDGSTRGSTRPGSSSGMSSSEGADADADSSIVAAVPIRNIPPSWSTPGPHGARYATRTDRFNRNGEVGEGGGSRLMELGIGASPSTLLTTNASGTGELRKSKRVSMQLPDRSSSPLGSRHDKAGVPAVLSLPAIAGSESSTSESGAADLEDEEAFDDDEEDEVQPPAALDIMFPSLDDPPPPPTPPYLVSEASIDGDPYNSSYEDADMDSTTLEGLKQMLDRGKDRENKWRAEYMRLAGEFEKLRWTWTEEAAKWNRRESEVSDDYAFGREKH